MVLVVTSKLFV